MCVIWWVFFVIQSWPFQKPVSSKQVPDYYDVVKTPIDLLTIRQVCLPCNKAFF